MDKYSQFPPLLLAWATKLLFQEHVHFPKNQVGDIVKENEDFELHRKVVVNPDKNQLQKLSTIFRVYFQSAWFLQKTNSTLINL